MLTTTLVLHKMFGRIVKLYPDNSVVKSGPGILLGERDALEFAAQLNLPVPRLVGEQSTQNAGELCNIRMSFIEGQRLDKVWGGMTADEKLDVCRQLRTILEVMQSTESKTGIIGSCNGGPARDCRQYTDYTGGPFTNEAEFNNFILDFVSTIPTGIRSALTKQIRTDHRIVFSHGDLVPHNIIIQGGRITGLIDWEYAGWYPEYWDFVKFFERSTDHKDWRNHAQYIFPQQYEDELAAFHGIMRWQRP